MRVIAVGLFYGRLGQITKETALLELSIFSLGLVLLTASLVAIVSRRLKLPYSVGLVMAGITLSLGDCRRHQQTPFKF
jgi:hypothetical protein